MALWADADARYAWLVATPLASLVDQLLARGDATGLRHLVREVVTSAQIVEHLPERRPQWLRAEVTWQPWVQALLDSGAAQLSAPPPQSAKAERHRPADRHAPQPCGHRVPGEGRIWVYVTTLPLRPAGAARGAP
jgi:hypothetical protein